LMLRLSNLLIQRRQAPLDLRNQVYVSLSSPSGSAASAASNSARYLRKLVLARLYHSSRDRFWAIRTTGRTELCYVSSIVNAALTAFAARRCC
jgi:hypothetical protein